MSNLRHLDRLLGNVMLFTGLFLLINGVKMVPEMPALLFMMEGEVFDVLIALTVPATWLLSFHVFQRAITEFLRDERKENASNTIKGEEVLNGIFISFTFIRGSFTASSHVD